MNRRCLLVTDGFPPATSSGVYRLTALARILPTAGWDVHVLTTGCASDRVDWSEWGLPSDFDDHVCRVPWKAPQISPRLKQQVREAGRTSVRKRLLSPVLRLTKSISNLVFFPDGGGFGRWVPPAVREALALCESLQPAAIYASAPSYSVCAVAQRLHQALGVPWICELRDPFYRTTMVHAMPTALHRRAALRLEREWLGSAEAVVVTTEAYRAQVLSDHPGLVANRVHTVYNGYDGIASGGGAGSAAAGPRSAHGEFQVLYCGVIDAFRDPASFFQAAAAFAAEDVSFAQALRIRFVGTRKMDVRSRAAEFGLDDIVELADQVGHPASVRMMGDADVLLNINYYVRGGTLEVPAKTFDYIASGTPILMLSRPGEAADIVARSGTGVVVPPDDVAAIRGALERLWSEKRGGGPSGLVTRPEYVSRFQREAQMHQVVTILDATQHLEA